MLVRNLHPDDPLCYVYECSKLLFQTSEAFLCSLVFSLEFRHTPLTITTHAFCTGRCHLVSCGICHPCLLSLQSSGCLNRRTTLFLHFLVQDPRFVIILAPESTSHAGRFASSMQAENKMPRCLHEQTLKENVTWERSRHIFFILCHPQEHRSC